MPSGTTVTYTPLVQSWRDPNNILRVSTQSGIVILNIPLRFLQSSSTNTWAYVLTVTKDCVNEDGHITSVDGALPGAEHPVAGDYFFVIGRS